MKQVIRGPIQSRIESATFWKTKCFRINAVGFCDVAADIKSVGGLLNGSKPTDFLCLLYKLTLLNPEREIIEEMLYQPYFKYLTAIAAVFVRLEYASDDIYLLLEPLLADYRKLRYLNKDGSEKLWHIDELIDELLHETWIFDLTLPRLVDRVLLEDRGLPVREPLLESDSESE